MKGKNMLTGTNNAPQTNASSGATQTNTSIKLNSFHTGTAQDVLDAVVDLKKKFKNGVPTINKHYLGTKYISLSKLKPFKYNRGVSLSFAVKAIKQLGGIDAAAAGSLRVFEDKNNPGYYFCEDGNARMTMYSLQQGVNDLADVDVLCEIYDYDEATASDYFVIRQKTLNRTIGSNDEFINKCYGADAINDKKLQNEIKVLKQSGLHVSATRSLITVPSNSKGITPEVDYATLNISMRIAKKSSYHLIEEVTKRLVKNHGVVGVLNQAIFTGMLTLLKNYPELTEVDKNGKLVPYAQSFSDWYDSISVDETMAVQSVMFRTGAVHNKVALSVALSMLRRFKSSKQYNNLFVKQPKNSLDEQVLENQF